MRSELLWNPWKIESKQRTFGQDCIVNECFKLPLYSKNIGIREYICMFIIVHTHTQSEREEEAWGSQGHV